MRGWWWGGFARCLGKKSLSGFFFKVGGNMEGFATESER